MSSLSVDCRYCGMEHERDSDGALIDRCKSRELELKIAARRAINGTFQKLRTEYFETQQRSENWRALATTYQRSFNKQRDSNELLAGHLFDVNRENERLQESVVVMQLWIGGFVMVAVAAAVIGGVWWLM